MVGPGWVNCEKIKEMKVINLKYLAKGESSALG